MATTTKKTATPAPAPANPGMPIRDYVYDAKLVEVIDGDTIKIDIDLGCDVWLRNSVIRFAGLNAPEKSTPEGQTAKAYVETLLPAGADMRIVTKKDETEKYGRYLADIYLMNLPTTVNQDLINKGYAKPWNGKGVRPV